MKKIKALELSSYLQNHIHYEIVKKHLYAFRQTKSQLECYKHEPLLNVLSSSSAGIFIEFETKANKIKLKLKKATFSKLVMFGIAKLGFSTLLDMALNAASYQKKYGNRARLRDYIEIIVNNNLIYSRPIKRKKIKVKFNNDDKILQKVRIFLPLYFPTGIKWVKTNQEVKKTINNNPLLLALGDSITQGFNANQPTQNYVSRLASILKLNVINQGVGSHFFEAKTLDELPVKPQMISVLYGTNDYEKYHDLTIIKKNITNFFEKLNELYPTTKTYVITPIWRKDYDYDIKLESINEIRNFIKLKVCDYKQMIIIDGLSLIDHDEQYFSDGYLHPNQLGFDQIAIRLSKIIAEK